MSQVASSKPKTFEKSKKLKTSFRFKVWAAIGVLCFLSWGITLYTLFHYAF